MTAQAEPVRPPHDPPERPLADLAWMLSQASWALSTELAAALEDLGLSPRAFCVLKSASKGEYTQTELANAIGLDKTTMVVTMDDLEAAGLAERRPAAGDRRARVVAITKAGERALAKAEKIARHVQDDVLSALPARERKVFVESLHRLVDERLCEAPECAHRPRRRSPRSHA